MLRLQGITGHAAIVTLMIALAAALPAQPRTVLFSGIPFYVRDTAERLEGPGPNRWIGDERSVWVDGDGLHLTLREVDGRFRSTEVYSRHPVPGYGSYTFTVETPDWPLDDNIVLGLFLYQYRGADATPQEYELDIEFSRWGIAESPPAHYTLMYRPAGSTGSIVPSYSFDLNRRYAYTVHQIRWQPGEVTFESWGIDRDGIRSTLALHSFTDPRVHPHDQQRLHMNFWMFRGIEPADRIDREIVIREVRICTD